MAMGGGPPLHRRPRGAGAAETTSWAVGGAPHMSPTPIWLVGHRGQAAIAATGVSGAALNSLFYRAHSLSFRGKIRDVGPIMKFQQQQQQIDSDLLK